MNIPKRKSLLSYILIVAMLLGVFPTMHVAAVDSLIGDVNLDGHVDTTDVRLLILVNAGSATITPEQEKHGDFDGNGYATTSDARSILRRLLDPAEDLIPLSGAEDVTDSTRTRTYTMYAEYSDTYTFTCSEASSIAVKSDRHASKTGTTSLSVYFLAGEVCEVTVTTRYANTSFDLEVTPTANRYRLPYKPHFTVDAAKLDVYGNSAVDPLKAASVEYTKRAGGTYVYLNNPEKLAYADIGQAIQRDEGLAGNVEVTWEHSNATGNSIYLGYQLKNEGTTDVYVTVQNIGFQTTGEWLGQQSWSEFYNRKINLPDGYFDAYGRETARYKGQGLIDYTPAAYRPTTYRIPAGQYIYVLGGTSSDAYNNANVASTANVRIGNGYCTNAVAKFAVTGGQVTGTLYCYTSTSQVKANPTEQGYITMRGGKQYGLQYKGSADHQGLIESNMIWYVNDKTPAQDLPVCYNSSYDWTTDGEAKEPYIYLKNQVPLEHTRKEWNTHINPNDNPQGVMDDMVAFDCVTPDGKEVTIDIWHTDGTGLPANLGNWMIDYHDNYTFVNQGNTTRYFTINKNCQGALMTMVLDAQGEVLSSKCTISPISEDADEREWELYTVEVPAHSVVQVTVSFLLMGNSYGNVNNWITLT